MAGTLGEMAQQFLWEPREDQDELWSGDSCREVEREIGKPKSKQSTGVLGLGLSGYNRDIVMFFEGLDYSKKY